MTRNQMGRVAVAGESMAEQSTATLEGSAYVKSLKKGDVE